MTRDEILTINAMTPVGGGHLDQLVMVLTLVFLFAGLASAQDRLNDDNLVRFATVHFW